MTPIDLCKQQKRDADPNAILQINFTENRDRPRNTFKEDVHTFILEEAKENQFTYGTVRVL